MKEICFTIVSNGVDGKEPTSMKAAFLSEPLRDHAFETDKNKAYLRKDEQIVDLLEIRKTALAKLTPIEILAIQRGSGMRD